MKLIRVRAVKRKERNGYAVRYYNLTDHYDLTIPEIKELSTKHEIHFQPVGKIPLGVYQKAVRKFGATPRIAV